MKAELKEFKDASGKVFMAIIIVDVDHTNPDIKEQAYNLLKTYIHTYVKHNSHHVYTHTEWDTVAAIVTFDLNNYTSTIIEI